MEGGLFAGQHFLPADEVTVTEKVLGSGSYASVREVYYGSTKCAAKKLHKFFFEYSQTDYRHERKDAIIRFSRECSIISQLRHPNIVQFWGLYREVGETIPTMIMEYHPTNLDQLIDNGYKLPEELNFSILHDVAVALNHLHNRPVPIIHRDLTANNVLIASNLQAKISDFGMFTNITQNRNMTLAPGNITYMPPESMCANPKYDESIDIFSFGVLTVHVLCREWPIPHSSAVHSESGELTALSEVVRRRQYLEKIGLDHPLMDMIKSCIHNDPTQRSVAGDLVCQMKNLTKAFPLTAELKSQWEVIIERLERGENTLAEQTTHPATLEQATSQLSDDQATTCDTTITVEAECGTLEQQDTRPQIDEFNELIDGNRAEQELEVTTKTDSVTQTDLSVARTIEQELQVVAITGNPSIKAVNTNDSSLNISTLLTSFNVSQASCTMVSLQEIEHMNRNQATVQLSDFSNDFKRVLLKTFATTLQLRLSQESSLTFTSICYQHLTSIDTSTRCQSVLIARGEESTISHPQPKLVEVPAKVHLHETTNISVAYNGICSDLKEPVDFLQSDLSVAHTVEQEFDVAKLLTSFKISQASRTMVSLQEIEHVIGNQATVKLSYISSDVKMVLLMTFASTQQLRSSKNISLIFTSTCYKNLNSTSCDISSHFESAFPIARGKTLTSFHPQHELEPSNKVYNKGVRTYSTTIVSTMSGYDCASNRMKEPVSSSHSDRLIAANGVKQRLNVVKSVITDDSRSIIRRFTSTVSQDSLVNPKLKLPTAVHVYERDVPSVDGFDCARVSRNSVSVTQSDQWTINQHASTTERRYHATCTSHTLVDCTCNNNAKEVQLVSLSTPFGYPSTGIDCLPQTRTETFITNNNIIIMFVDHRVSADVCPDSNLIQCNIITVNLLRGCGLWVTTRFIKQSLFEQLPLLTTTWSNISHNTLNMYTVMNFNKTQPPDKAHFLNNSQEVQLLPENQLTAKPRESNCHINRPFLPILSKASLDLNAMRMPTKQQPMITVTCRYDNNAKLCPEATDVTETPTTKVMHSSSTAEAVSEVFLSLNALLGANHETKRRNQIGIPSTKLRYVDKQCTFHNNLSHGLKEASLKTTILSTVCKPLDMLVVTVTHLKKTAYHKFYSLRLRKVTLCSHEFQPDAQLSILQRSLSSWNSPTRESMSNFYLHYPNMMANFCHALNVCQLVTNANYHKPYLKKYEQSRKKSKKRKETSLHSKVSHPFSSSTHLESKASSFSTPPNVSTDLNVLKKSNRALKVVVASQIKVRIKRLCVHKKKKGNGWRYRPDKRNYKVHLYVSNASKETLSFAINKISLRISMPVRKKRNPTPSSVKSYSVHMCVNIALINCTIHVGCSYLKRYHLTITTDLRRKRISTKQRKQMQRYTNQHNLTSSLQMRFNPLTLIYLPPESLSSITDSKAEPKHLVSSVPGYRDYHSRDKGITSFTNQWNSGSRDSDSESDRNEEGMGYLGDGEENDSTSDFCVMKKKRQKKPKRKKGKQIISEMEMASQYLSKRWHCNSKEQPHISLFRGIDDHLPLQDSKLNLDPPTAIIIVCGARTYIRHLQVLQNNLESVCKISDDSCMLVNTSNSHSCGENSHSGGACIDGVTTNLTQNKSGQESRAVYDSEAKQSNEESTVDDTADDDVLEEESSKTSQDSSISKNDLGSAPLSLQQRSSSTSKKDRSREYSTCGSSHSGDSDINRNSEHDSTKINKRKRKKQNRPSAKPEFNDVNRVDFSSCVCTVSYPKQAEGSHDIQCCTIVIVDRAKTLIRHSNTFAALQNDHRLQLLQQRLSVRDHREDVWFLAVQGTCTHLIQYRPPTSSTARSEESCSHYTEAKRLVKEPQADSTSCVNAELPAHPNTFSTGHDSGVGTGLLALHGRQTQQQSFSHHEDCGTDQEQIPSIHLSAEQSSNFKARNPLTAVTDTSCNLSADSTNSGTAQAHVDGAITNVIQNESNPENGTEEECDKKSSLDTDDSATAELNLNDVNGHVSTTISGTSVRTQNMQAEGSNDIPIHTAFVVDNTKTFIKYPSTVQNQHLLLLQTLTVGDHDDHEDVRFLVAKLQGTCTHLIRYRPPTSSTARSEESCSHYTEAKRLLKEPQADSTSCVNVELPAHPNTFSAGHDSGVGTGLLALHGRRRQSFSHHEDCDVDQVPPAHLSTEQSSISNDEPEWIPLTAATVHGTHEDSEEFVNNQPQTEEYNRLQHSSIHDLLVTPGRSSGRRTRGNLSNIYAESLCTTRRRRVHFQQSGVTSHGGPVLETQLSQPLSLLPYFNQSSVQLDDSNVYKGFVELAEPLVDGAAELYPSTVESRTRPTPVATNPPRYHPPAVTTVALPLNLSDNIFEPRPDIVDTTSQAFTAIAEQSHESSLCGP